MTQRSMKDIRPDEMAGNAFLGIGAVDAVDALVDGGISTVQQLHLVESALRATILHVSCYPLGARTSGSCLAEHGLVDVTWQSDPVSWDDSMPKGIGVLVEEALNRQTSMLSSTVRRAFADGRVARTNSAEIAQTMLNATAVAATPAGFVAVPNLPSSMQGVVDAIEWVTRYSIAYLGGAALLAVDQPRCPFVDAFDQTTEPVWAAYSTLSGTPPPAVSLPRFLPVVLARASRRDEIPLVVRDLKQEFSEQVIRFHTCLTTRDFTEPESESAARAAAQEIRTVVDSFFRLAKSPGAPSFIRKFGPKMIKYGAAVAGILYGEPAIALAGAFLADEGLNALDSQPWATRRWRPSLADRLRGLTVEQAEWQPSDLAKHLSASEVRLIAASARESTPTLPKHPSPALPRAGER